MEASSSRDEKPQGEFWLPQDSLDVHKQEIALEMALELQESIDRAPYELRERLAQNAVMSLNETYKQQYLMMNPMILGYEVWGASLNSDEQVIYHEVEGLNGGFRYRLDENRARLVHVVFDFDMAELELIADRPHYWKDLDENLFVEFDVAS